MPVKHDADPIKKPHEAERILWKETGIAVPFPEPRPEADARYKLAFSKPNDIKMIGSVALRTNLSFERPMTIDLGVTMPSVGFLIPGTVQAPKLTTFCSNFSRRKTI